MHLGGLASQLPSTMQQQDREGFLGSAGHAMTHRSVSLEQQCIRTFQERHRTHFFSGMHRHQTGAFRSHLNTSPQDGICRREVSEGTRENIPRYAQFDSGLFSIRSCFPSPSFRRDPTVYPTRQHMLFAADNTFLTYSYIIIRPLLFQSCPYPQTDYRIPRQAPEHGFVCQT